MLQLDYIVILICTILNVGTIYKHELYRTGFKTFKICFCYLDVIYDL